MVTDQQRARLVEQSQAATTKAFLTAPGGTIFGAAVLSLAGRIYCAGQYSSWNHVTNIHAEQAALLLATMSDDADVVALALASTSDEPVARPCGVCRQVMSEHSARTGRDFEVLMVRRDGIEYERALVSELLPMGWTARSQKTGLVSRNEVKYRRARLLEGQPPSGDLDVGDNVALVDGTVALVWDGRFDEEHALVKLKYTAPGECGARKMAHSFTEPMAYQAELTEAGWARPTRAGMTAAIVGPKDVSLHFPALPLEHIEGGPPGPLLEILCQAGIDVHAIRVTGSRAIGLHHEQSDWDLVVPVVPEVVVGVRRQLLNALEHGSLEIPTTSGTWKLLDRLFPGGQAALLSEQRFIDTVRSGSTSVAMMFVPPEKPLSLLDGSWQPLGRVCLHGVVADATQACYKRALYCLQTESEGDLEVVCYHKAANILREGDRVSVRGWLVGCEGRRRVIQMLPVPDNIVWLGKGM